jgi:hypothetical protein
MARSVSHPRDSVSTIPWSSISHRTAPENSRNEGGEVLAIRRGEDPKPDSEA